MHDNYAIRRNLGILLCLIIGQIMTSHPLMWMNNPYELIRTLKVFITQHRPSSLRFMKFFILSEYIYI